MSEGATIEAPARAWDTAVAARRSMVGSFSTSSPSRSPQCPWSVYSQRQTSVITARSGTPSAIARVARWTIPSAASAPLPRPSFSSGMPKRITPGIPRSATRFASATTWSTEKRSTPGIDAIASRTPVPSTMKSGRIRSDGDSRVSRTMLRIVSLRRRRRMRVTGWAMPASSLDVRSVRPDGSGPRSLDEGLDQ